MVRMEVGTSEEGEDWSTRSIEMMVEHMILAGEASSAGGDGFVEGEEEEEEEDDDEGVGSLAHAAYIRGYEEHKMDLLARLEAFRSENEAYRADLREHRREVKEAEEATKRRVDAIVGALSEEEQAEFSKGGGKASVGGGNVLVRGKLAPLGHRAAAAVGGGGGGGGGRLEAKVRGMTRVDPRGGPTRLGPVPAARAGHGSGGGGGARVKVPVPSSGAGSDGGSAFARAKASKVDEMRRAVETAEAKGTLKASGPRARGGKA